MSTPSVGMGTGFEGMKVQLRLGTICLGWRLGRKPGRSYWWKSCCSWRPQHFGDTSTVGWLGRTAAALEWRRPEAVRPAVCAVASHLDKPRRLCMILTWLQNSGAKLYLVRLYFCFDPIVTVPGSFFWSKKGLNLFWLCRSLQLETLNLKKKHYEY